MENKVTVSASPFIRSKETTATIMQDVVIALAPAALFGVFRFGFRGFMVLLLSVTACVLAEHIYKRLRKKPSGGYECSAVVTGLLLGMNLSADVPYWIPIVGGVFAIVVVKMLFGGLGRNLLNPALTAKCFLLLITGRIWTDFTVGKSAAGESIGLYDMFFGFTDGMIGETSSFLLLLGGLYLVLCKVISIRIPMAYILSFVVFTGVFGDRGFDAEYLAMQVCSGSLLLGAFFMTTDCTTSPITPKGKLVFGVFLGLLTGVFRVFGGAADGVAYAVMIGNLLVPLIERLTFPRSFGKGKRANR